MSELMYPERVDVPRDEVIPPRLPTWEECRGPPLPPTTPLLAHFSRGNDRKHAGLMLSPVRLLMEVRQKHHLEDLPGCHSPIESTSLDPFCLLT